MPVNIFQDIYKDTGSALRKRIQNNTVKFSYGLKFLNDATGGIRLNSLVVITGRTGAGKTAFAEMLADANRKSGLSVYSLFLEAEAGEISNRKLFRKFSKLFYESNKMYANYRDFYDGLYDKNYNKIMLEAEELVIQENKNFNVYYRDTLGFGLEQLEEMIDKHIPKDKPTLFIIDHIHHFDWEDTNDVAAIKRITKKIRDASLCEGLAIVMFAHIRKSDRKSKTIIPDVEDIHGSSEIYKEATQCISLAPYTKEQSTSYKFPTLFRISKDRLGALYKYVAKINYDIRTASYEDEYTLHKTNFEETELKDLEENEIPDWYQKKVGLFYGN